MQSKFEQQLEDLREAYFNDRSLKARNVETQIKHLEEDNLRLEKRVDQDSVTILEWEKKYNTLRADVKDLREKAKTNQKYVAGLLKDHENLQVSAIAYKDACQKVSQQKVDDMESEKKALQSQFDVTLDILEKRQRTLKDTIGELCKRLEFSDVRRRALAERLGMRNCMYEDEKNKRIKLEDQFLSSIQSMQQQIMDGSANLTGRLETLQTSVDGVASELTRETDIQECLDVLRKLQKTQFLTSKDGQKAESMLRFINEG
jgi:chromosome segregation ATPase